MFGSERLEASWTVLCVTIPSVLRGCCWVRLGVPRRAPVYIRVGRKVREASTRLSTVNCDFVRGMARRGCESLLFPALRRSRKSPNVRHQK